MAASQIYLRVGAKSEPNGNSDVGRRQHRLERPQ